MSAFFLVINRDKKTVNKATARQMMQTLNVFGVDVSQLIIEGNYAMGYQSHWTVPEELGECQPIFNESDNDWVMFHGRIDNRDELIQQLGDCQHSISDAQLMMRFYLKFGLTKLSNVIGPFAFVIFNPDSGEVLAARDGMGGRNLLYRITKQHILIATYEMAIVAHPDVDYAFNHARLARIIGGLLEDRLSSPIKGISPLEPGTLLTVNANKMSSEQSHTFYCFDAAKRTVLENDEAYAARFKALLAQSIERRLRANGKLGSMLSGGMDSVPMSILAAQQLAKKGQTLTAFSWVFDVNQEVDERQYSQAVCQDYAIDQVCINCDDVWPKFDQTTYVNPVMPFSIPNVEFQQAALNSARLQDVDVVLSGVHGDLLYSYTDGIIWELFKQKRWKTCFKEARIRLMQSASFLSWFKQYVLRPIPWIAKRIEKRRLRAKPECDWLTDHTLSLLKNSSSHLSHHSVKSLRPIGYQLVFGGFAGEDIAYGRHIDAICGVERRYPFRDRELCEFMLSIPSDQLNLLSVKRPLIKRAFENEFRPELMQRNDKTSFYPAISRGISQDQNFMKWFDSNERNWSFYVKKCYFNGTKAKKTGLDIVQWQCGYYDYWKSVCYDQTVKKLGLNNE